jgi:hypothetical protein
MKIRTLVSALALALAFSSPADSAVIGTLLVDDLHVFAADDNIDTLHFKPDANEMVEFKLRDLEFPAPLDFSAFIIHHGSTIDVLGLGPAENVPPNPVSKYFNVLSGVNYQVDILAVPNPRAPGFDFGTYRATVEVIPEAGTMAMMSLGGLLLVGWMRLKRQD